MEPQILPLNLTNVWPWASDLTSLYLPFLIYKVRMLTQWSHRVVVRVKYFSLQSPWHMGSTYRRINYSYLLLNWTNNCLKVLQVGTLIFSAAHNAFCAVCYGEHNIWDCPFSNSRIALIVSHFIRWRSGL